MNPNAPDSESYRLELDRLVRLPRFAGRDPGGPLVVALEGANGVGKTTLCHALAEALGAPSCLGTDGAWFSEPFRIRMIRDAEWHASALFFLSGCFEQMRVLRSRPERLVIMDRSLWSTLAVHAATRLERIEALMAMLSPVAPEIRVPDLTLVLEATFGTCQARIARKTGTARALDELTANLPFHAREQAFYQWLAGQRPDVKFLDVDHRSPREVVDAALTLVREWTPC